MGLISLKTVNIDIIVCTALIITHFMVSLNIKISRIMTMMAGLIYEYIRTTNAVN